MVNEPLKSRGNRSVTILPKNYVEWRSQKRGMLSIVFANGAMLFFIIGFSTYLWWYYQDYRFRLDGAKAIATVESWDTRCKYSEGRHLATHTINYQYKTDPAVSHLGRDWVKDWRHKPESPSAIKPKKNDEIVVEYLKSHPKTSRIVIPNRYAHEYHLSSLAMILSAILLGIVIINRLPAEVRLKTYGMILILFGLCIVAPFIYGLFQIPNNLDRLGEGIMVLLGMLTLLSPFYVGCIWWGYFLISRSRFTFSDPLELLQTEWLSSCGNRLTIVPRNFLGTDAAIMVDHQHEMIHFINCHVTGGFIPRPMQHYSCKLDLMRIDANEDRPLARGQSLVILSSPVGTTKLNMIEDGVKELIAMLRNPS